MLTSLSQASRGRSTTLGGSSCEIGSSRNPIGCAIQYTSGVMQAQVVDHQQVEHTVRQLRQVVYALDVQRPDEIRYGGEQLLDIPEHLLEVVEAGSGGLFVGANVREILLRQYQLGGLAGGQTEGLAQIMGRGRRDLGFDADRLAVLVDPLDLMLRKRLAHGEGRWQAEVDEHFRAGRVIAQPVRQPGVEVTDLRRRSAG